MTLRHVTQAGSRSGSDAVVEANNEEEIAEDEKNPKENEKSTMRRKR